MKLTFCNYSWIVLFIFLVSCGYQATSPSTEIPVPTSVSPTPIPASTLVPVTITPSPLPTQPIIPMITPDAIQVERWRKYENALARTILSFLPPEEVICEWDILGRSDQKVYVWAVCNGGDSSGSVPVVIHLTSNGDIQSVERIKNWSDDIPRLFPAEVQEKFGTYQFGRAGEMLEHALWRRSHPDEPPLIVLSATPMP